MAAIVPFLARHRTRIAIALLFAAGAAIRVHNALGYWVNNGFDGPFNWEYVRQLTTDWSLPDPQAHWSAARPPFFFYAGAVLARVFGPGPARSVWAIRLASSALGLVAIALVARHVARSEPDAARRGLRTAVAAGLLLFLPAHLELSAMLNEEITVASLGTIALLLAVAPAARADAGASARDGHGAPIGIARAAAIGALGGLAFLTKLTGCLVVVAVVAALVVDGVRRRALREALVRAAVVAGVALAVGGWFYARSLALHGYLYPHALPAHSAMLDLPPGERGVGDYLRFPLATFANPRVDAPELLHSVWGGTYATLWFDGQRHFVPRSHPNVARAGLAITLLALLPTAAFAVGATRAARRALRAAGTADAPMLALVALTLAGYVLFTWRNPWYVTVKGSYLLGLALPFAAWSSEVLVDWMRGPRWRTAAVGGALVALAAACALAFTWGTPLWTMTFGVDLPGLRTVPVGG